MYYFGALLFGNFSNVVVVINNNLGIVATVGGINETFVGDRLPTKVLLSPPQVCPVATLLTRIDRRYGAFAKYSKEQLKLALIKIILGVIYSHFNLFLFTDYSAIGCG